MPDKVTVAKAKSDMRRGKSASTAAGEFVREEIEHVREGKHGARSPEQAIAIGLSKARKAGIPVKRNVKGGAKKKGATTSPARKAAKKKGTATSPARKAAKKKSTTKRGPAAKKSTSKNRSRASSRALKREGKSAASKSALSAHAKRTAHTKRRA